MSVRFTTSNASGLLKAFDTRIAQSEPKGKITTWKKSDDGGYYTHKAADWSGKAWFKPVVEIDQLKFSIITPKKSKISSLVYAYYHGHLIETFLNHFDNSFTHAIASAMPEKGDIISDV